MNYPLTFPNDQRQSDLSKVLDDTAISQETSLASKASGQNQDSTGITLPVSSHPATSIAGYTSDGVLGINPILAVETPQKIQNSNSVCSLAFGNAVTPVTTSTVAVTAQHNETPRLSLCLGHEELSDKEIAVLLRHFMNVLSRWVRQNSVEVDADGPSGTVTLT
jgi:hypothetical protein